MHGVACADCCSRRGAAALHPSKPKGKDEREFHSLPIINYVVEIIDDGKKNSHTNVFLLEALFSIIIAINCY